MEVGVFGVCNGRTGRVEGLLMGGGDTGAGGGLPDGGALSERGGKKEGFGNSRA